MPSDKLTAELDRIEKLANAATAEPWIHGCDKDDEWVESDNTGMYFTVPRAQDAAFIADARTSSPRMVRMIRAQARWIAADRARHAAAALKIPAEGVFEEFQQAESALAELERKDGWV